VHILKFVQFKEHPVQTFQREDYNKYLVAHLCLCHSSTNQDFHEKFGLRFQE